MAKRDGLGANTDCNKTLIAKTVRARLYHSSMAYRVPTTDRIGLFGGSSLTTIAVATAVASHALAQTPASAPASSAYQGTVGDQALGRWTDYRFWGANFTRMATEDRFLIVTKLPDVGMARENR